VSPLLIRSVLLGIVAGFISGLFGVGGGIIVVPALVLLFGLTQFQASGTSSATIVAAAAAGLVAFAVNDQVDWSAALLIFVGSGTGAWLGARSMTLIPERALTATFAIIMAVAGVRMLL
jgi:uncharacterized membrane protein YfcA